MPPKKSIPPMDQDPGKPSLGSFEALSYDNTASKWLVHCIANQRTDCRHLPASCDV